MQSELKISILEYIHSELNISPFHFENLHHELEILTCYFECSPSECECLACQREFSTSCYFPLSLYASVNFLLSSMLIILFHVSFDVQKDYFRFLF